MMSINLDEIPILNISDINYCCFINGICKNEVLNLFRNVCLTKKVGHCKYEVFNCIKKWIKKYKNW